MGPGLSQHAQLTTVVGTSLAKSQYDDLPNCIAIAGRALGEADSECPMCGPGFRSTLDIRAAMQAGATQQVIYLRYCDWHLDLNPFHHLCAERPRGNAGWRHR